MLASILLRGVRAEIAAQCAGTDLDAAFTHLTCDVSQGIAVRCDLCADVGREGGYDIACSQVFLLLRRELDQLAAKLFYDSWGNGHVGPFSLADIIINLDFVSCDN